MTGFGRTDTHRLPNSLTWGPDGWLYGLNGVFNHSHVKYPEYSPHYREDHPGWKFTCALPHSSPDYLAVQVFCGDKQSVGARLRRRRERVCFRLLIDHLWNLVETGYYHRQGRPSPPFTWKIDSIIKHKHRTAYRGWPDSTTTAPYPEQYAKSFTWGTFMETASIPTNSHATRKQATFRLRRNPTFSRQTTPGLCQCRKRPGPTAACRLDWYDQYHCYQDARRDPAGIERAKGRTLPRSVPRYAAGTAVCTTGERDRRPAHRAARRPEYLFP